MSRIPARTTESVPHAASQLTKFTGSHQPAVPPAPPAPGRAGAGHRPGASPGTHRTTPASAGGRPTRRSAGCWPSSPGTSSGPSRVSHSRITTGLVPHGSSCGGSMRSWS
jgi:hypothetical protein